MNTSANMKDVEFAAARSKERHALINAKSPKALLRVSDLTTEELNTLIDEAIEMKAGGIVDSSLFEGKTISLLFQKTSTRTRCSFESGISELGGNAMTIEWDRSNFVLANLEDEIRVLSRYSQAIMARVHKHQDLELMAMHSEVPLINGLSDFQHPCQALGDLLTIKEYFKSFNNLKICYIGDGNNVFNSLAEACYLVGAEIRFVGPKSYWPDLDRLTCGDVVVTEDILNIPTDVDVIYTDSWVSIGQEEESKKRLSDFKNYTVTKKLMSQLPSHALFMHCLPAHRGLEVHDEVIDSPQSVVYDQAENRKHIQKALLKWMLSK